MNNNLCIDISDYFEPIEDIERVDPYELFDIDPASEKLVDLITRYKLVMDFGYPSNKIAYKPLEQYFSKIFHDKGEMYSFQIFDKLPPIDKTELEEYHKKYCILNADEVTRRYENEQLSF